MDISGGDGSIILTTKVDESGITKSTTSIKAQFAKVGSYLKTIGTSIQKTFSKVGAGIKNTFSKIGNWLKNFATSIVAQFATIFGLYALINFSKQSAEFATQTEASVQRLVDIYGEAAQSVGDFIDANARAIGMSKASASSFASVYGNLFSVWADQSTNAELTNRYLNMTAVVASKTGRTVQDVQDRVRSGLLGNTEAIEDLGVFVNVKTIEMTDAFQRMADGRSWEQLGAYEQQQIRTMAILEQATAKYGNTVADTTATIRAQYQAAYEDFQNTWGQVVNTVLIPVLNILTQIFTIATKGLQVMAGLSGKTVENSGQTSSNIKQQTKEQEKLNKAVKKGLAEFDEIKTLTEQSAENTADAGTGTQIPGIGDVGANYDNSFVEKIDADLAAIMGYVGFALAAIGIIMICFGHIGWGIGFLIAGAAIFSVSEAALSEGSELEKVKNIMNLVIAGISLLALVLGIILVCTTKNPKALALGIGLIVVGAAGLATEITLNWNAIKENVQKFIDENTGLIIGVASALLVLGIILCLCGVITPLSIGIIVAGAGILAAEVTLNWEETKNTITKFFQDNAGLIVGVSLAILVIGIVLCVCGIVTPLSIGMIVFGAAGLVAVVALNWNYIKEKTVEIFNAVWTWIKTWGLLVLGIILTISGFAVPLGLALIAVGAKSLTEAQNPTWLAIVDKIKEVWGKIKEFWNAHIAPIFTANWWANLGKKAINGLLGVIETGLNWIIDKINEFVSGLSGVANAVGDVIGVDWRIPKIPRVKIPRLAQGSVIPPNREFLAVLGDNKKEHEIVSPLSTMKQAFLEALTTSNINGGQDNRPIILQIDGRELARAMREGDASLGSQTVFGGFANAY